MSAGAICIAIAAANLMPSLRQRLATDGDLLTFTDTEPIQALQAILDQRPRLIVLERLFAATPRGAALINRIKTDPQLAHAEVRVMSHTGDYMRQVVKPSVEPTPAPAAVASSSSGAQAGASSAVAATPAAEPPRPLDWHGTRRATRYRVRDGVELQLDGNVATIIDLSAVGAQVLSPTILRPNQKVRVTLPTDDAVLRFRGSIAWAKFELPKPAAPPRYRAGVEFIDVDPAVVGDYLSRCKV